MSGLQTCREEVSDGPGVAEVCLGRQFQRMESGWDEAWAVEGLPGVQSPKLHPQHGTDWAYWFRFIIPPLERWRQEDPKFKVILGLGS